MFRAVLSAAPNSCPLYTQEWYSPWGDFRVPAPVAVREDSQLIRISKHHRNYTQLSNEVLILPVKLKETLTVNDVFTWYFCWVLNVNLHVQITCRLTALHVTQFTYAQRRALQTNVYVPSLPNLLHHEATFFCTTAKYADERNEQATFLPYHFPPEERKLVSSRAIRYTHYGWTREFCCKIQVCRMSHVSGKQQHRQTNYQVTLRRVRVTTVAVEKQ